jgi:hypothetical protein
MRHAFEDGDRISAIAKRFEVSEREVWSAAKNDRLGGLLNEQYWRHGLTVSLGNGLNVSEQQARRRLQYVALRLKRMIWGNDKRQRKIDLLAFKHQLINLRKKKQELKQGTKDWSDKRQKRLVEKRYQALQTSNGKSEHFGEHWHAVMAVRGNHGWSDQEIAHAIIEIEQDRIKEHRFEKPIEVEWDWQNENAFHSYIGREANYNDDGYFVMKL